MCCIWSGVAFWATSKAYVLIGGLIGPAVIMFYGRGFVYFALNDFDYFQNVKKLNLAIDKHNENIASMEKKKADIQQQLLDGTLMLPALPPPESDPAPAAVAGEVPAPAAEGEEDPEMNKPGLPVPPPQPDQNAAVQAMVEAERRKAEEAEARRQAELEGNEALKAEEAARRKRMEEQLKLEKEEKERQA